MSRLRASAFGAHGDRTGFLESVFFAKPALMARGPAFTLAGNRAIATAACDYRFSHSGFLSVSRFSSASACSLSVREAAFSCSALFGFGRALGLDAKDTARDMPQMKPASLINHWVRRSGLDQVRALPPPQSDPGLEQALACDAGRTCDL